MQAEHRLEHSHCELARIVLGVVPLGDDAVEELAAGEQLHDEVQHRRRLVHLVQLDAATDGAPAHGVRPQAQGTEAGVNRLRGGRFGASARERRVHIRMIGLRHDVHLRLQHGDLAAGWLGDDL
jgi:hypothetical protein